MTYKLIQNLGESGGQAFHHQFPETMHQAYGPVMTKVLGFIVLAQQYHVHVVPQVEILENTNIEVELIMFFFLIIFMICRSTPSVSDLEVVLDKV
jgi:hypothetical protein